MLLSHVNPAVLALVAMLSVVRSDWTPLPRCIRDCIDSTESSNCEVTDIACLCRASSGNYLPELVACTRDRCIDIGTSILFAPLQFLCELAGAPIPDSAIEEAESAAAQTTTVTTIYTSIRTATITTTKEGTIYTVLYPVTIERTKTVSGEPSTITKDPAVTYTTTKSTSFSSSASETSSSSSSISERSTPSAITSTSVLGEALTSSLTNTKSAAATTSTPKSAAGDANGAPFSDTNSTAYKGREVGNWFGLSVLIIMGVVWF